MPRDIQCEIKTGGIAVQIRRNCKSKQPKLADNSTCFALLETPGCLTDGRRVRHAGMLKNKKDAMLWRFIRNFVTLTWILPLFALQFLVGGILHFCISLHATSCCTVGIFTHLSKKSLTFINI
ncbi:hypothetical protein [Prevotella sp. OH937_COT-195]|uniref:hypothetical protein n=1 Tax=Prevotella sp. OH937_COT-195 TaxID=2491051 RepID=UPI000F64B98C|nr:hypothetical protein [Prevotella sp. OH937_COT-195]RRD00938.1 hypothetical protein EII32_05770 [Prevotella sp. OH937_COT-195]